LHTAATVPYKTENRCSFLEIVEGIATKPKVKDFCNSYLGFIVVRPLPRAIIGRTILATYGSDGGRRNYTCTRKYKVNLFGIELSIEKSLAFQEQDTVVAACATVSLWSCFHKTSDLFGTLSPRPAVITQAANQVVPQARSFPSNGLVVQQMCNAIRYVGLEPEVIDVKRAKKNLPLITLIYAHLRMGSPIQI
jgi:hypothetical protein